MQKHRGFLRVAPWVLLAVVLASGCRLRREGDADADADAGARADAAGDVARQGADAQAPDAAAAKDVGAKGADAGGAAPEPSEQAVADAGLAGDGGAGLEPPRGSGVIAHGGVGSNPATSTVALAAVHMALGALATEAAPVTAAARGVAVLEDSPLFNAGTGSSVRLDGRIEMSAAVMDSSGGYAAVLGLEGVRNPVLVALAALDAPSRVLAGPGAVAFARQRGFGAFDPATAAAHARRAEVLDWLGHGGDAGAPDWSGLERELEERAPPDAGADAGADPGADADAGADAATAAPPPPPPAPAPPSGAVAVLVRAQGGQFAGAISDGGPVMTLAGHVGAVGVRGAALYVGSAGAVAVSGDDAALIQEDLARAVYDRMQAFVSSKAAIAWVLSQRPKGAPRVGISAINRLTAHSTATEPMAWAEWSGGNMRTGAVKAP